MELNFLNIKYKDFGTSIPYINIKGKGEGIHLVVSGGMHGNESNGVYYVKKFLDWIESEKIYEQMNGQITIIPVVNVSGFKKVIRYVYEDLQDLNRCFGFSTPQTYSHEIANKLVENIYSKASIIVDIHDSGGDNALVPHTRMHLSDTKDCMSCTRELAMLFGLKNNLERVGDENMLALYLKRNFGISVLTIESGGGQAISFENEALILRGLKNLMINANLIKGDVLTDSEQYYASNRIYYHMPETGIYKLNFNLGDSVLKDQVLGSIYVPYTMKEIQIKSPSTGVIFSKSENNQQAKGRIIFSVLSV